MRILIAEDDQVLADGLLRSLRNAGYSADQVGSGSEADAALTSHEFDLVILDLGLPRLHGLEVLRRLRGRGATVPVLILTAADSVEQRVKGLDLGADDYMAKPFSPRELVARVHAQFRRKEMDSAPPPQLSLPGGIQVDLARLEVHRDGKVLPLTPREGDILEYLVRHRDRVVTREDLLLDVWHYRNANVETRTVDIHIVGLRRKVEPEPSKPTLIQTVRGKGYRWYA